MVPVTFVQVLLPLVRMLYELGSRFRAAAYSEDFFHVIEGLEKLVTSVSALLTAGGLRNLVPDTPFGMEVVGRELGRVVDMVNHHRRHLGLSEILRAERAAAVQREYLQANHPWSFAKTTPLLPPDPPGREAVDILDISTVPYAHLPGNYQDYPPAHWLPLGPERLLDTHFRLLREDLVGPIRQSVTAFLAYLEGKGTGSAGAGGTALSWRDGRFRGVVQQGAAPNAATGEAATSYQADLNVYSDAEVAGFDLHRRLGVCARIRFSLPTRLRGVKEAEFRGHWERTRRFSQGALVCLLWWVGGAAHQFQHVFGLVSQAAPVQDGKHHAIVLLHFLDAASLVPLARSFQSDTTSHQPTPHYIVEPNQLMFEAYRPILQTLQKVRAFTCVCFVLVPRASRSSPTRNACSAISPRSPADGPMHPALHPLHVPGGPGGHRRRGRLHRGGAAPLHPDDGLLL